MGILGAAGVVFFAFIGFDAVSTAAQEAKNPKRDMPIGILGSLVVCTILYVLFSYVLSGVATVEDFRTAGREASVAFAIIDVHARLRMAVEVRDRRDPRRASRRSSWSCCSGQSRVFYSMSRDGLVPKVFSDVHPRYQHAVQVEHAVLRVHGAVRGVHSRRHRRRDDQHRDAVRVHAGLRRRLDHARQAAGHPARLHGAGAAAGGDRSASSSAAR